MSFTFFAVFYLGVGMAVTGWLMYRYTQRTGLSADEFVMSMAELAGCREVAERSFAVYATAFYVLMVVFWPLNLFIS